MSDIAHTTRTIAIKTRNDAPPSAPSSASSKTMPTTDVALFSRQRPSTPGKTRLTIDVVLLTRERHSRTGARWRDLFVTPSLAMLLALLTFLWHRGVPVNPTDYAERARRLLRITPLIDGHNDLPRQLGLEFHSRLHYSGFDPASHLLGHTDLLRMRKGQMGGQFWSVYVDCDANQQHFEDPSVSCTSIKTRCNYAHFIRSGWFETDSSRLT
jgi:hypothetical protein